MEGDWTSITDWARTKRETYIQSARIITGTYDAKTRNHWKSQGIPL
jgi:hypothetical protein